LVTLVQIAEKAGVSPAVVSRVLNRDETLRVSKETRARVLRVVEEMDYSPNIAARSLRSSKSGLIALVVHDVSNPVYSEIVRGAQQAAAQANKALLLGDVSEEHGGAEHLVELVNGGGLDGMVLQGHGGNAESIVAKIAKRRVPTVLLQASIEGSTHLVSLPDEEAASLATRHLLDLQHRKIGCIGTRAGLTFSEARRRGWTKALRKARLKPSPRWFVHQPSTIGGGAAGAKELLDQAPDITGIVCCNILLAIGALETIKARGLRIPDDISIIALHDIEFAKYLTPTLTAVVMPLFELGAKAVEIVSKDELPKPGQTIIGNPAPVVNVRESTGPVPVCRRLNSPKAHK